MKDKTDLPKVKATARSLLLTDIHETEFSPVIVSHPFTDSGFVAAPSVDGEIGLLNITENDADQRWWREYMGKVIDKAKSAYEIYMMITKPYGLTFLKYTAQDLSQEDLSNILASTWTRAEAPNMDVNVSKAKLLSFFKQADPSVLMEQDEYIQFKMLDDPVTVYRGVTEHNAKNVKALSWTLNRETAEWFAHRFGENGTVYEAQIPKAHIYAFFNCRNESEVIVDPKYLTDISEVQDKAINHRRFRHRLNQYLKESEMNPMRYKNEKHQSEFEVAIRKRDKKDYAMMAALYLLTADLRLWNLSKRHVGKIKINFADIRLKNIHENGYALFCCAKDLCLGTKHLTVADLADTDLIPPKLFELICNAMAIRRFGLGAIKTTERTDSK